MLYSDNLTTLFAWSAVVLAGAWLWMVHHYSYWKRHNVPYIKPNFIFGNFKDIIMWKNNMCDHFQKIYESTEGPVVGLHVFNKPCLLIRDLELVKAVLVKDFNKFSNRFTSSDPHSDSLGADNLFFVKNPRWKDIRVKLTPVFTSGKMKQMFPLVEEIGREYDQYLCSLPVDEDSKSCIREVKEMNSLYSTDVIAIVAYGVRANSLSNPDGDFRSNGKRIFTFTLRRAIEFNMLFFCPSLVNFFKFKVFSAETTKFLRETLNHVMDERKKCGVPRNDLIDILNKFRDEAESQKDSKHFVLANDCLVAQAAIFFSAGFETSSSTISFSLYELSRHQDVQTRLREEVREALQNNDGKLTYEMVMDMKYLNNVVQEVLRFYPPLPFLDRECTLKENEPNYSLKPFVDYAIPNGMPIYIPIHALHKDPKYFPNPDDFYPDRFAPEHKGDNNFAAYMPFGHGPHNCIGERFGLLQTKVGLINFLRNHYVTPCEKSHATMKLDPHAIIIQSQGGIYCKLVRDPLV